MLELVQDNSPSPISFTCEQEILTMLELVVEKGRKINPKLNRSKVINKVLGPELRKALKHL